MVKHRSLSASGPSSREKTREKVKDRAMTFDFAGIMRREPSFSDENVDATTPMLSPVREESVSTHNKHKTEVKADIHHNPSSSSGELKSDTTGTTVRAASPPKVKEKTKSAKTKHSHSLEVVNPLSRWVQKEKRRVRSYEGEMNDYNRSDITEFNRGPFYSADFDLVSEHSSPELKSKVRYNDTGSLEDVNEDDIVHIIDRVQVIPPNVSESDTETINGTRKYRELWNLRATFEEDEELSDTIRMEDMASTPEQSPDREHLTTSATTSFESENTNPSEDSARGSSCHGGNFLRPQLEMRRHNYRQLLSHRLQNVKKNNDNSFDSVETMETESGDVSDTSRPEMTTTSFESTTDNTDSTGDSQTHRLQQMRGDSGYKSLENQQSLRNGTKKEYKFSMEDPEECDTKIQYPRERPTLGSSPEPLPSSDSARRSPKSNGVVHFERRTGKTASKKRRDYGKGRQMIQVYESINEPETDSKSDPDPSGGSFEETYGNGSPKLSVFTRFFNRSHSRRHQMARDYSVDSKTDALFNEFNRHDPKFDHMKSLLVRRSPRLQGRHRINRKNTEPSLDGERKRNKLTPEFRSASLGSDSSVGSLPRRLSPQDSIEEEYFGPESNKMGKVWENVSRGERRRNSLLKDIPIIKLPEEECADI